YDVLGSIAHAQMLGRCRIISAAESRKLVSGLKRILRNIESGHWKMDPAAEDVHTQIQSQLSRQVGEVSRKLHTARSRNDQVSLDLRLWCRDAVQEFARDLKNLQRALVRMAQANKDVIIPGYTHLQRAQPVLLAHHLLAFVEMLQRDQQRLSDVLKRHQYTAAWKRGTGRNFLAH
ncbi:MAG: argininosuccinate lyase, partial [Candidatus Omnitrophica bacterium]|nr:argininosuccinate lyase [Candidatus Omnitrophota bacterium]